MYFATATDSDGYVHDLQADSVEGIHLEMSMLGLPGQVTVYDEPGFIRGWATATDYRCA